MLNSYVKSVFLSVYSIYQGYSRSKNNSNVHICEVGTEQFYIFIYLLNVQDEHIKLYSLHQTFFSVTSRRQ